MTDFDWLVFFLATKSSACGVECLCFSLHVRIFYNTLSPNSTELYANFSCSYINIKYCKMA